MSRRRSEPKVSTYNPPGTTEWWVRWSEYDTQGRRKQRVLKGFDSEEAAQEEAVKQRARLRGEVAVAAAGTSVGEIVLKWWTKYAAHPKAPKVEAGTRDVYGRAMDRLKSVPLWLADASLLTLARGNDYVVEREDAGASPFNIRNELVVLSSAFQRAVEWGDLPANPWRGVRRPELPEHLAEFPTMEHLLRCAMTVEALPSTQGPPVKWRSMLLVAAFCGLRPQEQFALRRRDVKEDHLEVVQAIESVGRGIKTPKTHAGKRRVPIPPFVLEVLREWMNQAPCSRPDDLVWPTSTGSSYLRHTFKVRVWDHWRAAAGLEGQQWKHWRHFAASTWAAAGATILQCHRWMGHKTFHTTEKHYAFLFDADAAVVMAAVEDRVCGRPRIAAQDLGGSAVERRIMGDTNGHS